MRQKFLGKEEWIQTDIEEENADKEAKPEKETTEAE